MKKYSFLALCLLLSSLNIQAADWGDLLERLDSDYSQALTAETNVSWLGTTGNPNANLTVFQAREEFRSLLREAFGSSEKQAQLHTFLRESLEKDIRPETKVWLLEQFGSLGKADDVPFLATLLDSDVPIVANAAAVALAKIPGEEATAALQKKLPACEAALVERNRPIPAWLPKESKMPLGLAYASEAEVEQWMARYEQLDEMEKAQTLASLTARGDRKYRQVALAALRSDSELLQKEGFLALEKLATKDDVPIFMEKLSTDRDLAIRLAGFVVADGFDEALKNELSRADGERFLDLVVILSNRSTDVRAEVFARTTAEDCPNRLELLRQISKITTVADVPRMVASTLQFPPGGDRDAAENLIAGGCQQDASSVIALLSQYAPADLYSIIGRTGGDAAAVEIDKGLASLDQEVRNAAIRALSLWPNAKQAEKAFSIATDASYTEAQQIAALRSFIRVISLPDDKIGISISRDGKLEQLKKAFQIAQRTDEKRLILSRLAANRTVKSLEFAVACAKDPNLSEAAYASIADHAHDNALRQQNREVFFPAMDLVIQNSQNKDLVERVKRYKEQQ